MALCPQKPDIRPKVCAEVVGNAPPLTTIHCGHITKKPPLIRENQHNQIDQKQPPPPREHPKSYFIKKPTETSFMHIIIHLFTYARRGGSSLRFCLVLCTIFGRTFYMWLTWDRSASAAFLALTLHIYAPFNARCSSCVVSRKSRRHIIKIYLESTYKTHRTNCI